MDPDPIGSGTFSRTLNYCSGSGKNGKEKINLNFISNLRPVDSGLYRVEGEKKWQILGRFFFLD